MSTRNNTPLKDVTLATYGTSVGKLTLVVSDDALLYCGFEAPEMVRKRLSQQVRHCTDESEDTSPERAGLLNQARAQIEEYLARRRHTFSLPLDLRLATPFCRDVVLALDTFVPYGTTLTYTELAAEMQRPRAARAVGAALGANPICVVLPCHRVVGAGGKLTGYAGGIPAKRFLLGLEAGDLHVRAHDRADTPARIRMSLES
jgi:methylated-DNA-[protein]-cysteine S-methyltransferase